MSKNRDTYKIICKMHKELNKLIEKNDYDLTCEEVLRYSEELDRVIALYLREKRKNGNDEVREVGCLYAVKPS